MDITFKGSPHFIKGREGSKPLAIVIHIMQGTLNGTNSWFNNPTSGVSSHYGVGKNGDVYQWVHEEDTAWANGRVDKPTNQLIKDKKGNPNFYTISIEHEGDANDNWSDEMKKSSAELIRRACDKWGIPLEREFIMGHYEIYSKKPTCPAIKKDIIDELVQIAKDENMKIEKELREAIDEVFGWDTGKEFNVKEQKRLADDIKKIDKKKQETVEIPATPEEIQLEAKSLFQKFLDSLPFGKK